MVVARRLESGNAEKKCAAVGVVIYVLASGSALGSRAKPAQNAEAISALNDSDMPWHRILCILHLLLWETNGRRVVILVEETARRACRKTISAAFGVLSPSSKSAHQRQIKLHIESTVHRILVLRKEF